MGKKRKHGETEVAAAPVKKDDAAPERPQRTLVGWKDKNSNEARESASAVGFRNKEKVLVTCSRRINFRFENKNTNSRILLRLGYVFVLIIKFY